MKNQKTIFDINGVNGHAGWVVEGDVVKSDDRYNVIDNTMLTNLILSSTELHPNKSTSGHSHAGQEEVYFFMTGSGKMELDDNTFDVSAGDIVQIPDGAFHRVHSGPEGCYFVCVFDGRRDEKNNAVYEGC